VAVTCWALGFSKQAFRASTFCGVTQTSDFDDETLASPTGCSTGFVEHTRRQPMTGRPSA
jgi:hypothetical protein